MLYRRLAGLVAGLVMSQLVLSRSDIVCLQHDRDASPTTAAVTATPEAEHQHGQRHEHHPVPGDLPVPEDCCQAMTTCSVSVDLSTDDVSPSFEHVHGSADALVATLPPSRVESPDPPPPKS